MSVRSPVVLICPRVSPQWELAATLALVKPKPFTKAAIKHRKSVQQWPRNARRVIADLLTDQPASVTFPANGRGRAVIELAEHNLSRAKRLACKLTRQLPGVWFTLDRLYIRDGVFYQRGGRYNLELTRTTQLRLRRKIRAGYLGDLTPGGSSHVRPSARHRTGQNQPAQSDR